MHNIPRRLSAGAAVFFFGIMTGGVPAFGQARDSEILTYQYSGNTVFFDDPPHNRGGVVSGYVTFKLPPNYSGTSPALANAFTGREIAATWDCAIIKCTVTDNSFVFNKGRIQSWDIGIDIDQKGIIGTENQFGSAQDYEQKFGTDAHHNYNNPGIWTLVSEVPDDGIPIASDFSITTQLNTPVAIDLKSGSIGHVDSADLISTPEGGTVSGFPSTKVTFTPTTGNYGPAYFFYDLDNANGSSNPATVTVTIDTKSRYTPSQKALAYQLSENFDAVSLTFEVAANVADSATSNNPVATLLKDTALTIFVRTLAKIAAQYDELFGDGVELTYGFTKIAHDVLKKAWKSNPVALALEIDSVTFSLAKTVADAVHRDPPDFNYQEVARPSKLRMPTTGNPVVDDVTKDYLKYASLEAATLHAAERWQGARIDRAKSYEVLQMDAFHKYAAFAAAQQKLLQKDNERLRKALPPVDIKSFPGGAKKIASIYRSRCGKPLPKKFNDDLLSLGVPQDTINALVCESVSGTSAKTVSTDFKRALSVQIP